MSAVPLWKVIVGPVPTNWNRTLAGPVFFEPESRQDRGAYICANTVSRAQDFQPDRAQGLQLRRPAAY
jgi:hypothetical protein